MSRELLLWQVRWLLHHYMLNRQWQATQDPLWALWEKALESGDWAEYRAAREAAA